MESAEERNAENNGIRTCGRKGFMLKYKKQN